VSEGKALLQGAAPVLPVDNAAQTAEYYRVTLGFTIERLEGDPPYYAIVQRDGVLVHLSEREDTSKPIERCSAYIYVSDADALYEEYRRIGIEMFAPPENQDNEMREFELSDMNGHFLTFGQKI
jgi:uncharacterized glyoxalase superfamily protein PhnB